MEKSVLIAPSEISCPPAAPADASRSRSATISQNDGSEVYWSMPSARAKGSEPRFRSCGRQPSMVVSSVTASAAAPIFSARAMRLSTRRSSVDQ